MIKCPVINQSTAQKMYMHIQWEMDTFKHRIFKITDVKVKLLYYPNILHLNPTSSSYRLFTCYEFDSLRY